ncbi:exonuclease subunit SbcD [Shewanella sp. GXUN23E]|uniref:exonuclease subunit SbcD n=1 Tax=Shewanella sp. GXUN23E TaxID=3422498 RepID=UPI003D7C971E
MRILHTSDWHLGQSFYGKSRQAEHRAFLAWLLAQIEQFQIDALIVAGDIFDTSTPPSYARTLYNQFVVQMQGSGCQLFVLGGNHDSVAMLSESSELLACLGTVVVPNAQSDVAAQVFTLHDRQGQAVGVLGAVPFLRPRDLITSQAGEDGAQKQLRLGEAIKAHYDAVYAKAHADARALANAKSQTQKEAGEALPVILTGHLTTVGASSSESVRDIYIGTLDAFNASGFPPADYIALGHIHRPQKVAGTEHIRYSGSPLCLSFDELGKAKQVLMAEFDAHGLTAVQELKVPMFQPMAQIKGDLEGIARQLDELSLPGAVAETANDTDSIHAADRNSIGKTLWLAVEVQSQEYLSDLQSRVEALVGERPFEVLQLKRQRQQTTGMTQAEQETLSELSIEEVFERRLTLEHFDTEAEQARVERLKQLYRTVAAQVQSADANVVTDEEAAS